MKFIFFMVLTSFMIGQSVFAADFPSFKNLSLKNGLEANCKTIEAKVKGYKKVNLEGMFSKLQDSYIAGDQLNNIGKYSCAKRSGKLATLIIGDDRKNTLMIMIGDGEFNQMYGISEHQDVDFEALTTGFNQNYQLKLKTVWAEPGFTLFKQKTEEWVFSLGKFETDQSRIIWINHYLPEASTLIKKHTSGNKARATF